ncbi:MAG TPA: hypothetical protein VM452_03550, partial [Caulifigura sp.]|nr:hypothetical protein [Caulifigura sp.]
ESQNASNVRRRFTTDSWDRLEFTRPRYNPFPDSQGPSSGNDEPMPRQFEFTTWLPVATYGATDLHFPPQFGPTGAEISVTTDQDPFRTELRTLLWTTVRDPATTTRPLTNFDRTRARSQHRLNVNGLLVNFDASGNPIYRPLTPHPSFDTQTVASAAADQTLPQMYHGQLPSFEADPVPGAAPADYPPFIQITTGATPGEQLRAQEWWARFDRQRMARDIYVLLWTLGGAQDLAAAGGGPNPYTQIRTYTDEQAREMAQFAVNVVDSLDRDDVITRFEYDPDLTDGWNPSQAVYGVESQLLTFSEVLLINEPAQTGDLSNTLHRDNDSAHQFLYIELRNTSPRDVSLDDETWRIVRVPADFPVGDNDANVQAAIQFKSDGTNAKQIGPGENFVIACHDGNAVSAGGQPIPGDFYANYENGTELEAYAPYSSTAILANNANAPTLPLSHLDLHSTDLNHQPFVTITRPLSVSDPVNGGVALVGRDTTATTFDLVLQRRRNLLAKGHGEGLGAGTPTPGWVEVDRIKIDDAYVENFDPTGDTQSAIQTELAGSDPATMAPIVSIVSLERSQPFASIRQDSHPAINPPVAPTVPPVPPITVATPRNHSLIARLEADPHRPNGSLAPLTQFSLWEPHFNRDFSSVMELLSIPLYGYQGTTGAAVDALTPVSTNVGVIGGAVANIAARRVTPSRMDGFSVAGLRFLNPSATLKPPHNTLPINSQPHYANRWYRLLEFVTVPDRSEETVAGQIDLQRRAPGKINLNTLRDETVLKGVIDDNDQLVRFDASTGLPSTTDTYEATRNWYSALLATRDGVDPISTVAIPGTVASRPFRDLAWVNPDRTASTTYRDNSVESTILRSFSSMGINLTAAQSASSFGLFEARTQADAAAGQATVDYHSRNRLVAKIHNRTTNRSHVFIVWTTVGFFEAHQVEVTVGGSTVREVQIGAEVTDIPRRRAFMACDMSRLEEAYEDPDPTDDQPGTFDFRKFIIYRKLIK